MRKDCEESTFEAVKALRLDHEKHIHELQKASDLKLEQELIAKAAEIEKFCTENQLNYVAFDNFGHGQSSREFHKCNIIAFNRIFPTEVFQPKKQHTETHGNE
jgi:hypothetical protein